MSREIETVQVGNWVVTPKLNKIKHVETMAEHVVTPKVMMLLTTLIENRNCPLSVDELAQLVWPDRVVSDNSVYQAVAMLRKVLNEDSDIHDYIERISSQGYRIVPQVEIVRVDSAPQEKNRSAPLNILIGALITVTCIIVITKLFNSLVKSSPVNDPYFESVSLAQHLASKKRAEKIIKAKQIYSEVLEKNSQHTGAMSGLCNTYMALATYGSLPESKVEPLCRPLLEAAIKLDSNSVDVLTSMARLETLSKNYNVAIRYFSKALDLSGNSPMLWYWDGRYYRETNNLNEALKADLKAFRLAPNDPTVLRGLAYTYLNLRDLKSARKYFERSVEIAPHIKNIPLYQLDFYPLNIELAESYRNWFTTHIEDHTKMYPLHRLSHILFLLSIGNSKDPQEEFEKIKPSQRASSFGLYVEAAISWHQQDKAKAVTLLKQRYLLAPQDSHYVMPYIMGLYQTQKFKEANRIFEKHFSEISMMNHQVRGNVGNYLLYSFILQGLGEHEKVAAIQKLMADQLAIRSAIKPRYLPYWHFLDGDQQKVVSSLFELLNTGWLPDANDNMFVVEMFSGLIEDEQIRSSWLIKLEDIQKNVRQQVTTLP
ncbi:winged helix-turn-helix domain-containing protein [Pseudoalteromonas luteoviolacea]|uniref:OmpR/PhoB-type domain-containing protein n=1 Tax=Pseudoalteromonas luteoviolacea DSM 6061 TaxID=1365250 RepID=A0A166V6X1_9GAMM|nr:winged helix-turn-helix domain-containing protein [Pseudoalteromonas luteoviolacea]KZN31784.1 hypothetical protein N475_04815 [Pseudoalteromonas luteoviolacea DSM 6061]MBE0389122.1 hypothetical protein [Pseudoalteromonas luteoviolacea DSM 6061]